LAQAERTSTAATRAIRFIEIISMWRTRKAQRETAPWYAVLGRVEDTNTGRNVKTSSMHHAWGAHAYAKRRLLIRPRRENTWSRHVPTLTEVQQCKIRPNCRASNWLRATSLGGALPGCPDTPYLDWIAPHPG
jgi:hypothetical protein